MNSMECLLYENFLVESFQRIVYKTRLTLLLVGRRTEQMEAWVPL